MKKLTVILFLFCSFAFAQHHTGPPKKSGYMDNTDFSNGDEEINLPPSNNSLQFKSGGFKVKIKPYEEDVKKIPEELDSINKDATNPCPEIEHEGDEDKSK